MPVLKISTSETFKVLEMEKGANDDEIKRKYKQLALKWCTSHFHFLSVPAGMLTLGALAALQYLAAGRQLPLSHTHTRTRSRAHTYTHALFLSQLLRVGMPLAFAGILTRIKKTQRRNFRKSTKHTSVSKNRVRWKLTLRTVGTVGHPTRSLFYAHSAVITYAAPKYGQKNSDMIEWKSYTQRMTMT